MVIGGRSFECTAPLQRAASAEQAAKVQQYIAQRRAAGLYARCFSGVVDSVTESFKLCVGLHFSTEHGSALHEDDAERVGEGSGFVQSYRSADGLLRANLSCTCGALPRLQPEPPCRPGSLVQASLGADQPAVPALVLAAGPDWLSLRPLGAGEEAKAAAAAALGVGGRDRDRRLSRSEAVAEDGRQCLEVRLEEPLKPQVTVQSGPNGARNYSILLETSSCCSAKMLRELPRMDWEESTPDRESRRLLAPLQGHCLRAQNSWWTYELCWPWRVQQIHVSPARPEVNARGADLGSFAGALLTPRRTVASAVASSSSATIVSRRTRAGSHEELVTVLTGDPCIRTIHHWAVDLPTNEAKQLGVATTAAAAGGSFNPVQLWTVSGPLAFEKENMEGCTSFSQHYDGAILLVERGGCWFHLKALHAQAAGAVGVVVFNDKRQMVVHMEGVEELMPPDIPTVLVERPFGRQLQKAAGVHVVIRRSAHDGLETSRPLTTTVTFRCSEEWRKRRQVCQVGDEVDVKVWLPEPAETPEEAATEEVAATTEGVDATSDAAEDVAADSPSEPTESGEGTDLQEDEQAAPFEPGSEEEEQLQMHHDYNAARAWRGPAVRVLKATILQIDWNNQSLLVSWQPQVDGDGVEAVPDSPIVPLNVSFRDGVSCDSMAGAFIERVAEPQACQAELVVHVAALCAYNNLAPPLLPEPQAISCYAAGEGGRGATERVSQGENSGTHSA